MFNQSASVTARLFVSVGAVCLCLSAAPARAETLPDMAQIERAWGAGDFVAVRADLEILARKTNTALAQYRYGRVLLEGRGGPIDHGGGILWLKKAVAQHSVEAATLLARFLLNDKAHYDATRAAALFETAATRGDVDAQYYLGLLNQSGTGIAQDATAAFDWFLAASEGGNTAAQFELSRLYAAGNGTAENPAQAVHWLNEAASLGHARAQYFLGLAYDGALELGAGVEPSEREALRWYQRAAEQGLPLAQRSLGTKYLQGLAGEPPNASEALRWLEQAAQANDPGAMHNLAIAYASGTVFARDDEKAMYWLGRASELNLGRATFMLGRFFEAGRHVSADLEQAVKLYVRAATQGEKAAALHLGRLAVTDTLGGTVAPHTSVPWAMILVRESADAAALEWVRAQAEAGIRPAQVQLGLWLLTQEGQAPAAAALLDPAAVAGEVAAQFELGRMFMTGTGVTLDYVAAHAWLNIAAASGHEEATQTRALLSDLMTAQQVAQAQTRARQYFETARDRAPQTVQTEGRALPRSDP